MKWFVVLSVLLLIGGRTALAAPQDATPARDCAAITSDLAAARSAGKLDEAAALFKEASAAGTPCQPKDTFCLGRSAALGYVEAAYDSLEKKKPDEATKLLEAGQAFGEPWTLMVALGDDLTARARATHDPKLWSEASVAYQKAYSTLAEPSLCPGEPPLPPEPAMDQIIGKLSVATLLAKPLVFFHSKCAPCNMVFLTQGLVASRKSRVLPITFDDGASTVTAEGRQTLDALSDCVIRQKWSSIEMSAHTDERGSQPFNLELSRQRLESVKKILTERGFTGRFEGQPKGKSEPMVVEDREQLTAAEARRLERRVELRAVAGEPRPACFADAAVPKP